MIEILIGIWIVLGMISVFHFAMEGESFALSFNKDPYDFAGEVFASILGVIVTILLAIVGIIISAITIVIGGALILGFLAIAVILAPLFEIFDAIYRINKQKEKENDN